MFDFHTDNEWYFQMQTMTANEYIIPFIEKTRPIYKGMRVLEIGCGEAGVLKAFLDRGCVGIGVELNQSKLEKSHDRLTDYVQNGQLKLINKDIYQVEAETEFGGKMDVIILKDVIEHIHDQEKLIVRLKSFLNPDGVIFFGFPPWQMPFGGHQQICRSRFLSRLPYFHLLPKGLYKAVLKGFKENPEDLLEIKETGISIERFEKTVKKSGYKIVQQTHYFINPIYQYKFNMKVQEQSRIIRVLPWVRNFFTTAVYYLIKDSKI